MRTSVPLRLVTLQSEAPLADNAFVPPFGETVRVRPDSGGSNPSAFLVLNEGDATLLSGQIKCEQSFPFYVRHAHCAALDRAQGRVGANPVRLLSDHLWEASPPRARRGAPSLKIEDVTAYRGIKEGRKRTRA